MRSLADARQKSAISKAQSTIETATNAKRSPLVTKETLYITALISSAGLIVQRDLAELQLPNGKASGITTHHAPNRANTTPTAAKPNKNQTLPARTRDTPGSASTRRNSANQNTAADLKRSRLERLNYTHSCTENSKANSGHAYGTDTTMPDVTIVLSSETATRLHALTEKAESICCLTTRERNTLETLAYAIEEGWNSNALRARLREIQNNQPTG